MARGLRRRRLGGAGREPVAHVELGVDVVRIARADAELDVVMSNGVTALGADDLAGDGVTRRVVAERHRRTRAPIQPLVAPGEHGRADREEVAPHLGQQVLIPRRVVLVEPLGHDARVDQLAQAVGQRVAGDVQGPLELIEVTQPVHRVPDDEQGPGVTEHVHRTRQRAWPGGELTLHESILTTALRIFALAGRRAVTGTALRKMQLSCKIRLTRTGSGSGGSGHPCRCRATTPVSSAPWRGPLRSLGSGGPCSSSAMHSSASAGSGTSPGTCASPARCSPRDSKCSPRTVSWAPYPARTATKSAWCRPRVCRCGRSSAGCWPGAILTIRVAAPCGSSATAPTTERSE